MPSPIDLDPRVDPLVGQTLGGKYTLEKLVGRGGMGHVYSATVTDAGESSRRDVVVKMIAPPLAQQPQAMARFEREAKRLDGLRHSNIVEMYDYGREGGRAYIVMEWVDGELLSDYLARRGALSLADFVPIAAQVLKGVGHAHSRDLMIRDIKPSNVMLCERKGRANFVKIIDFGLAKMLEGDEDITKQHFIGTSGYLSPEQIKGLDIDLRVDVYALGVLFYQMLSGRMPFEAENDTTLLYKHVHDFPTPLSEVLPEVHEVPEELVHLIHDCLEKDPNDRPRDANEIVEKLIDCVPMSMFKLPPASPAAAEQTAISALSTAALAAPTGETATFLRSDDLDGAADSRPSGRAATVDEPVTAVVREEPTGGKSKLGLLPMIVVGVGVVAALVIGGVVVFGGKKEPTEQQPTAVAQQDADTKEQPEPKKAATGDAEPEPEPKPEPQPAPDASQGTIEISSTPSGELSIDGSPVGNTPYDKPLPLGKHTIEIVAEGHATWTKEIEIKAGENPAIDVKLDALSGKDEGKKPTGTKKPISSKPTEPEQQPQPQPEPQPKSDPN
ncbi:MAG TPA: serine/threonine-protein kinase, partial [Enhygromyxa sp.]|nr:serine/threonine-protein kinase [Enhygromyxa sp.]